MHNTLVKKILESVRIPHRDIASEIKESHSSLDSFAIWITEKIGTVGFFLIISFWTITWLGWNLVMPINLRFDPAPAFVFWLFISNLIQILLMPLIMLGQNVQTRHHDARSQYQLDVNLKSEKEIEILLEHLHYQTDMIEKILKNQQK